MTDRKIPGVAFWATVVVVSLAILVSVALALSLLSRADTPTSPMPVF